MRFLLRNLTSCSINKLTSLKFQVQLPIYNINVRAIMHGLHDLTGNDDKSLKGESLVCFDFRNINTMKQRTLYCDLLLRGSPSLFSCILFNCFFFVVVVVFFLFSRSGGHKTKETYSTRPRSPTPCKQGLRQMSTP